MEKKLNMSDGAKISLVVVGVVLAAAVWNVLSESATDIFKPAKPPEGQASTAEQKTYTPTELLKDIPNHQLGPKDAPVVVRVLMAMHNPCHAESVNIFRDLYKEYQGQVRVVFSDTADPEVAKIADTSKIGCEMGLLINGKAAFKIPGKGLIMFQGPANMGHGYNMDDLYLVIDKLIKDKTGKPPKRASAKTSSGDAPASAAPAQPRAEPSVDDVSVSSRTGT